MSYFSATLPGKPVPPAPFPDQSRLIPGRQLCNNLLHNCAAAVGDADQGSDSFRYPTTKTTKKKEGAPFDFCDRGIDLSNVREVMQGLANSFECTSLEFSHRDEFAPDQ